MGAWRYKSIILDLGTRWKWVVSFSPRPLYSGGKNRRYLLDRRLDVPENWSACYGEEKNLLPLQGIEPRPSSP
jgi:hypothetical protein